MGNFKVPSQKDLVMKTDQDMPESLQSTSQWSFISALLNYYKEFLETDFKTRFKPKRRVVLTQEEGLTGINLTKYPHLNELSLDLLTKKFNILKLQNIDEGEFSIYPDRTATDSIEGLLKKHGKLNEDKLLEEILDSFEDYLKKEKFLDQSNLLYSRSELKFLLKESTPQKYPSVIRKYRLLDFYRDITVLLQTRKLTDKTDFYFYFYDIKYDGESYPIFYIPVSIEHPPLSAGSKPHYSLSFEGSPIIYVNEKALQFISEKISESQKFKVKIELPKRQFYWNEVEDIVETLNDILTKISNRFELPHFQLGEKDVRGEHEGVKVSSNCYITVFDKSDEAIVNDYEALLLLLEQDSSVARELFNKLIEGFLLENPKVVTLEVDEKFDDLSISEKLTFKSPISLNSEQIKILEALRREDVKRVIVEGPPGTGKSHTISAIIYDALLNNKSVLVASDKKEALDVVEEKISEVLERIKVNDDGYVQNPILRLGQAENNFNKIFQTQNFEKIKTRFGAYKFNYDKTQEQINERIQQMQDDITSEVGLNKELYSGVLEATQNVIKFENKKLNEWKNLIDIDELKDGINADYLGTLYQTVKVFSNSKVNLNLVTASWLKTHIDEEAKEQTQLILDNLNSIDELVKGVDNKARLEDLVSIITKNNDGDWKSFLTIGDKLSELSRLFNENEKELFLKSINEPLAIEKISQMTQDLENIISVFSKAQLLYEKHKAEFKERVLVDIDNKNSSDLEEYLNEIKKIKSFLWTFTKKSQIESLNRKLKLAFSGSNLINPHSIIPQLESEHLIYKEVTKLREDLNRESSILCELFDPKNLNTALEEDNFNGIKGKLVGISSMLQEIEELINKSKVLELCRQISTSKEMLVTQEKIREVTQTIELTELINHIDDAISSLDLPKETWEIIYSFKIKEFLNSSAQNKLTAQFRELLAVLEYVGDKSKALESIAFIKNMLPLTLKKLSLDVENINSFESSKLVKFTEEQVMELLTYFRNLNTINEFYSKVQPSHYNIDRTLLQNRFIANMTYILDKNVVEFRTDHTAEAQAIKQIIKSKQQIPKKLLRTLINAFPCLIVNIRELGEYLPLEPELFDLVIIDEASQVSIAQAFPALLRAKKIIVLGDTKQFSNVKTSTASIPINNEAFSTVKDNYQKDIRQLDDDTRDAVKNKISRFNIKVSILEFMLSIANYQTMLRKHFRCYPEVIEYSNETFYGRHLQPMKLRGKNIQDVIRFVEVEDSKEPVSQSGAVGKIIDNANENEAKYILTELEKLAERGSTDSIGVITPFRNQQKYIYEMLRNSSKYSYFDEKMKLKVMTFDSCQGEERDIVYYSMVESPSNSARLSSVFAKSMSVDVEEGKLREQRLNVGFSRAKELVVFVISKKPDEFKGEIGIAIKTFRDQLQDGLKLPAPSESESEGEKRLLSLIKQTSFYRENKEWINIQAQFPIGQYLKRINNADIPNYQTDFLLTLNKPDQKPISMILEYDGFEFHFKEGYDVNKLNYDDYYIAQDITRTKDIETYGYEFVRMNKFILRDNPVEYLDDRFNFIVKKKT